MLINKLIKATFRKYNLTILIKTSNLPFYNIFKDFPRKPQLRFEQGVLNPLFTTLWQGHFSTFSKAWLGFSDILLRFQSPTFYFNKFFYIL